MKKEREKTRGEQKKKKKDVGKYLEFVCEPTNQVATSLNDDLVSFSGNALKKSMTALIFLDKRREERERKGKGGERSNTAASLHMHQL